MKGTGNLYEMVARDRLNRPTATCAAWLNLSIDQGDGIDAVRVTMADVPHYVKGPKAGQLNFQKCTNRADLYVTPEMLEAWLAEHPDVCRHCANTRELFVRWSADDGTTMRPCDQCNIPKPQPEPETMPADSLFGINA